MDREFNWDDIIENDGGEYILLPEGDYDFKVLSFERERHQGSAKLPPCNKAVLNIEVTSPQGKTTIRHNLFLHSKCEGLLCAFFSSIGQRKRGEKLQMNWNSVTGATGKCKVKIHTWTKDDGSQGQSNEISKFYEKEDKPTFTPGAF